MRYHQHCRISQNHSHTLNDNILIGLENPCGRKDHHNAVNGHGQRHHRQKRICSKQKIEDRTFLQLSDFFGFSQFASRPFLILSKWKLVHQPNILIPVFDKRFYNAKKSIVFSRIGRHSGIRRRCRHLFHCLFCFTNDAPLCIVLIQPVFTVTQPVVQIFHVLFIRIQN